VSIPLQHRSALSRLIDEAEGGTVLCPACFALLGCPVCFALYAGTPALEAARSEEDAAGAGADSAEARDADPSRWRVAERAGE
jgi:hypothetical protein